MSRLLLDQLIRSMRLEEYLARERENDMLHELAAAVIEATDSSGYTHPDNLRTALAQRGLVVSQSSKIARKHAKVKS